MTVTPFSITVEKVPVMAFAGLLSTVYALPLTAPAGMPSESVPPSLQVEPVTTSFCVLVVLATFNAIFNLPPPLMSKAVMVSFSPADGTECPTVAAPGHMMPVAEVVIVRFTLPFVPRIVAPDVSVVAPPVSVPLTTIE